MKYIHVLSKNDKHFLDQATRIAEMSDHHQRHGAIIRKAGKTLAVGINRNTNDPSILGSEIAPLHSSIHAEIAALNACKKTDLTDATIYVARVSRKDGSPTMSKPCLNCQKALAERGVKKVVYTIDSSLNLN